MNRFKTLALTGIAALLVAAGSAAATPAQAADYGPWTCRSGYVWRDVVPGDYVCVKPEVRDQVATSNYWAASNWVNGAYGPKTCRSGLVWRAAYEWDLVCVTPTQRAETAAQNRDWCFHAANITFTRVYTGKPIECGAVPFNPPH